MFQPLIRAEGRPLISAVTGTNGKTSVATATLQLMKLIGWRASGYDSTGITDVHGVKREAMTRRSPDYLPDLIDNEAHAGADALSIEAFVGILADGLFERVEVDTAVSTGLERDHLNIYGTVEKYWDAKLRLFEDYLRPDGVAILTTESAQGELVRASVRKRGARLLTIGAGGDIRLIDPIEDEGKLTGRLDICGELFRVSLPSIHAVAITNLLLAAAAVIGAGGAPGVVVDALARVTPPPGRLQVIAESGGVTGMVDTAHNPGALRKALEAVRSQTRGRLLLVFGAGGERDRAKRPEMGAIAAKLADLVILTDDNPRREPAERIRAEIRSGVLDCIEIPRRKDAILAAIEMARPGDTVLVAGKGDEEYQLVGVDRVPFDDREIIRQAMTGA